VLATGIGVGLLQLIFNLITDLVYRLVDPRIEFAS